VPWIVVATARLALAHLAAEFFGHPSRQMQVVGITGTNGKTTTSYVAQAIFEAAGTRCGLMGTVTYRIGDREIAATRTTPEAPEVHGLMRQMLDAGCGACVMEVSSHALAMHRVEGMTFDVRMPEGIAHVQSTLVGKPNVYNILAAAGTTAALGVPLHAIEQGLQTLSGVPGRFEVASSPADDITVVVDYAHTDDALRNLLETARPLASRRLITVFGAGGDRDKTKRPLMGMVAARLSDVVVVTSDNPRTEDPARIIEEVKLGAEPETRQRTVEVLTIIDRREAIVKSIQAAVAGDVVLLAGKGHEKYQEVNGRVLPFDD